MTPKVAGHGQLKPTTKDLFPQASELRNIWELGTGHQKVASEAILPQAFVPQMGKPRPRAPRQLRAPHRAPFGLLDSKQSVQTQKHHCGPVGGAARGPLPRGGGWEAAAKEGDRVWGSPLQPADPCAQPLGGERGALRRGSPGRWWSQGAPAVTAEWKPDQAGGKAVSRQVKGSVSPQEPVPGPRGSGRAQGQGSANCTGAEGARGGRKREEVHSTGGPRGPADPKAHQSFQNDQSSVLENLPPAPKPTAVVWRGRLGGHECGRENGEV